MAAPEAWNPATLLWLCGTGLRLTILAVPPVITAIQADLNLSGTQVGILSALPVVLFAIFSVPGSLLIARLGIVATLIAGLLITAVGASLRGAVLSVFVLYAATVVMGAGVAMMQVALPAAVRAWMPTRVGFATALYTNGLLVGEILPVALTIPLLLPLVASSWRWSLALWALPVIAFAVLVALWAPRTQSNGIAAAASRRWWPDWTSPLLWQLGLVFAAITSTYFGANAFLPGYLTGAGRADLIAPALTALNVGQLPASFLLLAVASRVERQAWPFVAFGVISLIGVVGVVTTASVWTVAWAAVLGCALAGALTLAFALPALLSVSDDVARVSAGMFTIGYTLSVVLSVIAGAAWDFTGSATFAFLPLGLGVLPLILLPLLILRRERRSAAA